MRMRGSDVRYRLELDFLDAINGGKRQITLPDGSALDVNIPPARATAKFFACAAKAGREPAAASRVTRWSRSRSARIGSSRVNGDDIHVDLPITLSEAVLGGKVKAPTPSGAVTMTVPKWSNTGSVLRLRARACRAGRQQGRRIRHAESDAAGKARSGT